MKQKPFSLWISYVSTEHIRGLPGTYPVIVKKCEKVAPAFFFDHPVTHVQKNSVVCLKIVLQILAFGLSLV